MRPHSTSKLRFCVVTFENRRAAHGGGGGGNEVDGGEEEDQNDFENFTFLDSGALHAEENSGEWNGEVGDYDVA